VNRSHARTVLAQTLALALDALAPVSESLADNESDIDSDAVRESFERAERFDLEPRRERVVLLADLSTETDPAEPAVALETAETMEAAGLSVAVASTEAVEAAEATGLSDSVAAAATSGEALALKLEKNDAGLRTDGAGEGDALERSTAVWDTTEALASVADAPVAEKDAAVTADPSAIEFELKNVPGLLVARLSPVIQLSDRDDRERCDPDRES
jgi:hypothetical protein